MLLETEEGRRYPSWILNQHLCCLVLVCWHLYRIFAIMFNRHTRSRGVNRPEDDAKYYCIEKDPPGIKKCYINEAIGKEKGRRKMFQWSQKICSHLGILTFRLLENPCIRKFLQKFLPPRYLLLDIYIIFKQLSDLIMRINDRQTWNETTR